MQSYIEKNRFAHKLAKKIITEEVISDKQAKAFARTQGFRESEGHKTWKSWSPEFEAAQSLGSFALDMMTLRLQENEFRTDILAAMYEVELENPQNMRDHDEDIDNITKAQGHAWVQTSLQALERMRLLGTDVAALMKRGEFLFPNDFGTDEVEEETND